MWKVNSNKEFHLQIRWELTQIREAILFQNLRITLSQNSRSWEIFRSICPVDRRLIRLRGTRDRDYARSTKSFSWRCEIAIGWILLGRRGQLIRGMRPRTITSRTGTREIRFSRASMNIFAEVHNKRVSPWVRRYREWILRGHEGDLQWPHYRRRSIKRLSIKLPFKTIR